MIKNLTHITGHTNSETTSHAGIYSIQGKKLQQKLLWQNSTQSRKKNLWTQMINQNKWPKHPFLPHFRAQRHIQFFLNHLNQTHTLQKIPKTSRICDHFQNKSYKTRSKFLPNLTIPGEHHTEERQNQNRKRIGRKNVTLCHHTFENV